MHKTPPSACLRLSMVSLTLGGRQVLDGLSLTAARGAITALLGPNGAGKTTTVRCCTGLLTADSGDVEVVGATPAEAVRTGRVAVMPQSAGAWSGIRVGELLRHLASLHAHPNSPDALSDLLGLGRVVDTPYRRLSGGQQQAVNLAAALVGRPELVFLDEPTAGMDPHARRRTWQVMRDLRMAGVSIVLTTHAMDEAAELADHVWIMDAGRITVHGTVRDLTRERSLEDVYLSHTHSAADRDASWEPDQGVA